MRSIGDIEHDFKSEITAVVVPLQTMRAVNTAGLARLVALAIEGAEILKGEPYLPRSFLIELYGVVRLLRAEAQHNRNPQIQEVTDRLGLAFDLILIGEVPGDRQVGVPRVL